MIEYEEEREPQRICISPLATRPVLYTDTVGGNQTCRDDLWAVTTEELNKAEQDAKDAARYRWLRDQRGIEGDLPVDGDVWVVQLHQPRCVIPELRCAGFGEKLDRAIDAAMKESAA